MITIDLSKQQALDADPGAIQQISFAANLDKDDDATPFFIIEQAKETIFEFTRNRKSFMKAKYSLILISIK